MALILAHSILRAEEKLLVEAAARRGAALRLWDVRRAPLDRLPAGPGDVLLARCVSHGENEALARFAESRGIRVVNPWATMALCGDKGATSARLAAAGLPQPEWRLALSAEAALEAVEELGYPAVLKPVGGSWGRLLARADGREAAEAILEHKERLGGANRIFYVQRYVEKGGSDVRAFLLGGEPLCAIRRHSAHWITNTARGGRAEGLPPASLPTELLRSVAAALGGDFLAADLFETPEGWLVNEVNDGAEFRNSIDPTGTDIPGALIDLCLGLAEPGRAAA